MSDLLVGLNDMPDEILIHIFKQLHNVEALYYLIDVNQRIDTILRDPIFTCHLCLFGYSSEYHSVLPLQNPILDRFCSTILPQIGHQITSLYLERTSVERILHATNDPNLHNLGLYDMDAKTAERVFLVENPLVDIYKNQISALVINFTEYDPVLLQLCCDLVYEEMLTKFTNLQCLIFIPCSSFITSIFVRSINVTPIVSPLLELHINVSTMHDCSYLLDGRFDRLQILYVTSFMPFYWSFSSNIKEPLLPNLRILSLECKNIMNNYDESLVPFLHRMINLEELHLNIMVTRYDKFIDGDTLKNDIAIRMPRLYKFTFDIYSIIQHHDQTNFSSCEDIGKTFDYWYKNEIFICVGHCEESGYSKCHIYSCL